MIYYKKQRQRAISEQVSVMLGMGIDRGEKIDGFENIWGNNDSSTSISTYFSEYGL